MFSALFTFLGGSVFRMLWGEISSFMNKKQDHAHEIELLRLQSDMDAARHGRDMEAMRVQSELGIKTIEAQTVKEVESAAADAFVEAMKGAFKPTGITLVDTWNGVIRPSAATIALILWFAKLAGQGFRMDEWDMELSGAILGFFFADRSLGRRGK